MSTKICDIASLALAVRIWNIVILAYGALVGYRASVAVVKIAIHALSRLLRIREIVLPTLSHTAAFLKVVCCVARYTMSGVASSAV